MSLPSRRSVAPSSRGPRSGYFSFSTEAPDDPCRTDTTSTQPPSRLIAPVTITFTPRSPATAA